MRDQVESEWSVMGVGLSPQNFNNKKKGLLVFWVRRLRVRWVFFMFELVHQPGSNRFNMWTRSIFGSYCNVQTFLNTILLEPVVVRV